MRQRWSQLQQRGWRCCTAPKYPTHVGGHHGGGQGHVLVPREGHSSGQSQPREELCSWGRRRAPQIPAAVGNRDMGKALGWHQGVGAHWGALCQPCAPVGKAGDRQPHIHMPTCWYSYTGLLPLPGCLRTPQGWRHTGILCRVFFFFGGVSPSCPGPPCRCPCCPTGCGDLRAGGPPAALPGLHRELHRGTATGGTRNGGTAGHGEQTGTRHGGVGP